MFDARMVGSFQVNTSNGINYGVASFADNVSLSSFLQGDGSTLVYNNNNLTYSSDNVFISTVTPKHLPGVGTFLSITGYIYIPPSLVGQPLTYSIKADDGTSLNINGAYVINNGGLHAARLISGTAEYLTAGLYPVTITYYDGAPVDARFEVFFPPGTLFLENLDQFNVVLSLVGLTPNQSSVAAYLNRALLNGKTDSLLNCLSKAVLNDPNSLPGYLDELDPLKFEVFAGAAAFEYDDFVIQEMDNYLAGRRDPNSDLLSSSGLDVSSLTLNASNSDPVLQGIYNRLNASSNSSVVGSNSKWDTLISGNVILGQTYSDAYTGLAHSDSTSEAVLLGQDYRFTSHFLAGLLFGYNHTGAALDNIGSNASLDAYSPGFYASYADNGWYSNTLGTFTFDEYRQSREVNLPCGGTAVSSPTGWQAMINTDAGYDVHDGPFTYGPAFGVHYTHLNVDSYSETGLKSGNLDVSRNESDSFRSRLGGRGRYAFNFNGVNLVAHCSASWQHEFFDSVRGITSQFSDLDNGYFTVETPRVSPESALADIGLDAQLNQTLSLFASYYINVGQSDYFAQSVQAGVKISF